MDKGTVIRTTVLALALVNQFLVATELNPIPGSEELWAEVLATIFTSIAAGWAWFKNNDVTVKEKKKSSNKTPQYG